MLALPGFALAILPWAAFYGVVHGAAWLLGPMLFPHCRKLDAPGRAYWASSVVSTVNSFVLTPLAWRACEQSELLSLDTSFTASTRLSTTACVAMVGYTVWDSVVLARHRKHWSSVGLYAMHHAGSALSWGLCAITGYAHVIAVPSLLFEATGPLHTVTAWAQRLQPGHIRLQSRHVRLQHGPMQLQPDNLQLEPARRCDGSRLGTYGYSRNARAYCTPALRAVSPK